MGVHRGVRLAVGTLRCSIIYAILNKRYTRAFFYKEDHRKLAALFELLDQRGCLLLLSNSYHPDIIELYGKYDRQVVRASRFINCKGSQRGAVNELIISNFPLSQGLELHGLP